MNEERTCCRILLHITEVTKYKKKKAKDGTLKCMALTEHQYAVTHWSQSVKC